MIIESLIISRLASTLSGVTVCGEIPADPPDKMVIVQRKGTDRENRIYTALLQFDCYGASQIEAAELSAAVQDAVEALTVLPEISCCEFGGDFCNNDPANRRHRYTTMYNITYL